MAGPPGTGRPDVPADVSLRTEHVPARRRTPSRELPPAPPCRELGCGATAFAWGHSKQPRAGRSGLSGGRGSRSDATSGPPQPRGEASRRREGVINQARPGTHREPVGSTYSSGPSVVEVEKPAKAFPAVDRPGCFPDSIFRTRREHGVALALVVALVMVVGDVVIERPSQ